MRYVSDILKAKHFFTGRFLRGIDFFDQPYVSSGSKFANFVSLSLQIIIVGRVTAKQEEPMRTLFEINDNTGTFKVIFYQKGENEVPIALKNFDYQ